jgi:putative tricarboxylic transport membrane protein
VYELLLAGIVNVMQLKYLVPLALGTLVGVVGGALPGVSITLTVFVALPFTFGLDPLQGLRGRSRPSRSSSGRGSTSRSSCSRSRWSRGWWKPRCCAGCWRARWASW